MCIRHRPLAIAPSGCPLNSAQSSWPTGCPGVTDCADACETALHITACGQGEDPSDGCANWERVAVNGPPNLHPCPGHAFDGFRAEIFHVMAFQNFQFENNAQDVCGLDGCGRCCYEHGDDCEAPEAGDDAAGEGAGRVADILVGGGKGLEQ